MNHASYSFNSDHCFIVDQYNDAAPFASFLPGIAGVTGIPAWVFYVNRGQAIASFGVRNKDGAFLEFFPADKAYQLTASRGFRTFLKISGGNRTITHEPFQREAGRDNDVELRQRLYVSPHEVGVEEINPILGLTIRADMFTLPETPVAALVRRVMVRNTSPHPKTVEIVDGLPQMLPFGLNQWCVKFMSRTVEAYMVVEGIEENTPYFRLKVLPTDSPVVEPVLAGNFFVGFDQGLRNPVLVDAERVFGMAGDFSLPERFFSSDPLDFDRQVAGNRTPSAFQALNMELAPGESRVFYGLYGHASCRSALQGFLHTISNEAYFEDKREDNRRLVEGITQRAFTATAYPLFDAYAKQCYLDNGLRGGFTVAVPGGQRLYLFGRKHGDLERDYNDFLLQDSTFSEGNGDFRDMLQNRRMDLFFDPALGAKNIHYFFNLIQPDGYNPQLLRNTRFVVESSAFKAYQEQFPELEAVLSKPFKYAQLWQVLSADAEARERSICPHPGHLPGGEGVYVALLPLRSMQAKGEPPPPPPLQRGEPDHSCSDLTLTKPAWDIETLIADILRDAQEIEDVEFDRGYWSDHWTYLVDLLESYAAIYPDHCSALFHEKAYTFYDPIHFVQPRSHKYVVTPKGIRQQGAVVERKEKRVLIESRSHHQHHVRYQMGTGEVVTTTLLGKVLTVVANKLASLDPDGIGIEMEADRPGWCDAMNGLPGLFGSSVNETIELKRLVDFTLRHLSCIELAPGVSMPTELTDFLHGLEDLMNTPQLATETFWRLSHDLKEGYRDRVFMGFQGEETVMIFAQVINFLHLTSNYLEAAFGKAKTPEGIITYFAYEAEEYRLIRGQVEVTRFRRQPLPLFLEGFVHAMRIATQEEARNLYHKVCDSELFDKPLGMFRVNVPLGKDALDFGRIGIFNYGWLENGSVFLHMHYKFVLEMARRGLIGEFYAHMENLLVPFHQPEDYRRNPIENASFLVGSGFEIDPREQGKGCVARLTGATAEFLHLWTHLFLGASPFLFDNDSLTFRPSPHLSKSFFCTAPMAAKPFGEHEEILPNDSVSCALLGNTLLVYINPERLDTFGADAAVPQAYTLYGRDGGVQVVEGAYLAATAAEALRLGQFRRVDIVLNKNRKQVGDS